VGNLSLVHEGLGVDHPEGAASVARPLFLAMESYRRHCLASWSRLMSPSSDFNPILF
jgi:hypothetical protein